jgi:hypothetical protein
MTTLAMALVLSVTSSQIGVAASNKDGKGRHHCRRFVCPVWISVIREGEGEEEKEEAKERPIEPHLLWL